MTVSITSNVFGVGATGAGRITAALVSVMNSSPTFVKMFDAIALERAPSNITISVGTPGRGTSFSGTTVTIDPNDFTTYAGNPKLLVARIGHELAHAADAVKASGFAGADGITAGPTSASILSPAEYNVSRAKDEGFGLYQEFLIAKELALSNFSADPGVRGFGIPGLFAQMSASYNAMTTAGLPDSAKAQAMIAIAGTAGRNDRPSTNGGLNDGLTYGQVDNKEFIVGNFGFTDASGNVITSDKYPTSNIVGYWQDDNGSFRISAINPTTGQLVTKDYVISGDGKTRRPTGSGLPFPKIS